MASRDNFSNDDNPRTSLFARVFEQHYQPLLKHGAKKLGNYERAQDIVQETFVALWNSNMLDRPQEISAYLYGTIRHKILDEYRRDAVRLRYANERANQVEEQFAAPDQQLLARELKKVIDEEIARMPERMREIFNLKKQERLTISEIANKLEISEQTVKNQLHRANNRLKDTLIAYDSSLLVVGILLFGLLSCLMD